MSVSFDRSLTVRFFTRAFPDSLDIRGVQDVSELRVEFDINITAEPEPNYANIRVFNLSEQSRDKILNEFWKLQIYGGYKGFTEYTDFEKNLGIYPGELLFFGDMTRVKNRRAGTEWVTEIEALEGYAELKGLIYSKTWQAGTLIQVILLDICKQTGLSFDPGFTPLRSKLKRAVSYNDATSKILNKICKSFNLQWYVFNGVLEITERAKPLLSALSKYVLMSPDTGLVGSPEITMDEDPQTDTPIGGINATSLLNGKLAPKRLVKFMPTNPMSFAGRYLNAAKKLTGYAVKASGIYVIESVRHYGCNQDGEFNTDIYCPIWG